MGVSVAGKRETDLLPRWLIIVQHDKPDVYASLRESFVADGRVRVIRDRRRRERRTTGPRLPRGAGRLDRRRRDRRQPSPAQGEVFSDTGAFFVIARDRSRSRVR